MDTKTTQQPVSRLTRPRNLLAILLLAILAALAGCYSESHDSHSELSEFENGYNDGFALDEEYFFGYDDSWFTIGFSPILYQGGDIPFIDDFSYDAGYYDGIFDAYNDGYFIAYRYAFIIGFSEGYDNAHWPDYLTFLANDIHIDYLNGGFSDGYNDGFSEGRVFGAYDYEAFFPLDWLDAFLDWESGTDLIFEEIGVGTGEFGPVVYYEWGLDPNLLRHPERGTGLMRSDSPLVRGSATETSRYHIQRPLGEDQLADLSLTPALSLRSSRTLRITESWLDRVYAATGVARSTASASTRSTSKRAAPMQ